jgi:PPP family 3-phenylpropionic acid transporter
MTVSDHPPGYHVRLAGFIGAAFLFIGCFMPYFPVWLKHQGFASTAIALIVGLPIILRVPVSFAISMGADALGDRRRPVIGLACLAILSVLALQVSAAFWPVLIAACTLAIAFGAIIPLSDAIALTGPDQVRAAYGRIRLWGSVTFILANVIGGYVIARAGPGVVPGLALGALFLVLALALFLPRAGGRAAARRRADRQLLATRVLLRNRTFLLMALAFALIQASHGIYYVFSVIHWRDIGHSTTVIGGLWALGVLAEVALFAYSGRFAGLFGAAGLIALGGLAGIVRWTVTATDPSLAILALAQGGHALTFGATHLGGMAFIERAVPERLAATAQSVLHGLSTGIIGGMVFVASGPLFAALEGRAYLVMAGLSALGLALALALNHIWRGGKLQRLSAG